MFCLVESIWGPRHPETTIGQFCTLLFMSLWTLFVVQPGTSQKAVGSLWQRCLPRLVVSLVWCVVSRLLPTRFHSFNVPTFSGRDNYVFIKIINKKFINSKVFENILNDFKENSIHVLTIFDIFSLLSADFDKGIVLL